MAGMRTYRVYVITPDNHIKLCVDLRRCVDDQSAKERAKQLADENAIELWDRDRLVARFEPKQRTRLTTEILEPIRRGSVPREA
jgi:hypothetical protein